MDEKDIETQPDKESSINDIINIYVIGANEIYGKVLDKFGKKLTSKFMRDASDEQKECFMKRLKDAQTEKMNDRLTMIMNRILTDHHFMKSHDEIMSSYKTIEELREDNEIVNNHLQSVENESSILQRDTDMAIDKLESVCETILMMHTVD